MAATVFKQLVNNLITTLGASYTAGSGRDRKSVV